MVSPTHNRGYIGIMKAREAEVLKEVKWRKPSSSILRVPVWETRADRVE